MLPTTTVIITSLDDRRRAIWMDISQRWLRSRVPSSEFKPVCHIIPTTHRNAVLQCWHLVGIDQQTPAFSLRKLRTKHHSILIANGLWLTVRADTIIAVRSLCDVLPCQVWLYIEMRHTRIRKRRPFGCRREMLTVNWLPITQYSFGHMPQLFLY